VTVKDDGGTDLGGVESFTQTFVVTVDPLPDAPILDSFLIPVLPQVKVNTASPDGVPVSDLLANADEVDGEPLGIAVVAIEDKNSRGKSIGTWEYLTDADPNWQLIAGVTADSALLLSDDAGTRIRFRPAVRFAGYASISFKAWDQSSIEGETELGNTTLGDTAYSDNVERAWVFVSNAKPKVDSSGAILKPVREDSKNTATFMTVMARTTGASEEESRHRHHFREHRGRKVAIQTHQNETLDRRRPG
jgi:hypothetical protein